MMRYGAVLLVVLLGACSSSDNMSRNFGVSRTAAADTTAAPLMPLSMPPGMSDRPQRPNSLMIASQGSNNAAAATPAPSSAGQAALMDAAGPESDPSIRRSIDENAGMVYPGADFTNQLLNWTPPPGYRPLTQQSKGGWLSGLF